MRKVPELVLTFRNWEISALSSRGDLSVDRDSLRPDSARDCIDPKTHTQTIHYNHLQVYQVHRGVQSYTQSYSLVAGFHFTQPVTFLINT